MTITGLTPGTTYTFSVQSRNVVGLSGQSASINVLAAQIPDPPTDLINVAASTSSNQITLAWTAPIFDGGSLLLDYRLWFDNASGSTFQILQETVTATTYTAVSLTQGQTYQFKVEARNAYGFSQTFSNTVTILAA